MPLIRIELIWILYWARLIWFIRIRFDYWLLDLLGRLVSSVVVCPGVVWLSLLGRAAVVRNKTRVRVPGQTSYRVVRTISRTGRRRTSSTLELLDVRYRPDVWELSRHRSYWTSCPYRLSSYWRRRLNSTIHHPVSFRSVSFRHPSTVVVPSVCLVWLIRTVWLVCIGPSIHPTTCTIQLQLVRTFHQA